MSAVLERDWEFAEEFGEYGPTRLAEHAGGAASLRRCAAITSSTMRCPRGVGATTRPRPSVVELSGYLLNLSVVHEYRGTVISLGAATAT